MENYNDVIPSGSCFGTFTDQIQANMGRRKKAKNSTLFQNEHLSSFWPWSHDARSAFVREAYAEQDRARNTGLNEKDRLILSSQSKYCH